MYVVNKIYGLQFRLFCFETSRDRYRESSRELVHRAVIFGKKPRGVGFQRPGWVSTSIHAIQFTRISWYDYDYDYDMTRLDDMISLATSFNHIIFIFDFNIFWSLVFRAPQQHLTHVCYATEAGHLLMCGKEGQLYDVSRRTVVCLVAVRGPTSFWWFKMSDSNLMLVSRKKEPLTNRIEVTWRTSSLWYCSMAQRKCPLSSII